jgi:hypothetical protein
MNYVHKLFNVNDTGGISAAAYGECAAPTVDATSLSREAGPLPRRLMDFNGGLAGS